MYDQFAGSTVLITGGTGSFGRAFVRHICQYGPRKVIVFSRDEFKQHQMAKSFAEANVKIRFLLGDVRDSQRLERALEDVDYVVHAAALKQVPALEYNPIEAVKTNILGANNIVDAALNKGVKGVVALSTDKAVNPLNLYGATKLVAEKIFIDGNAYGGNRTKFSVVRYGNVLASRGSVIEHYLSLIRQNAKELPVTDERMTRFWMTLGQSASLVIKAMCEMEGGEIFVPKIPSMKIVDLVKAIMPDSRYKIIGIRSGEKLHETLISEDESRHIRIFDGIYVIMPQFFERRAVNDKYDKCKTLPEGFVYRSDINDQWMTPEQLRQAIPMIAQDQDDVYVSNRESMSLGDETHTL